MYAIIKTGGKQYKVAEGDVIKVEKLKAEVGETITFDDVKLLATDEKATVKKEDLASIKVEGKVLGLEKGKKLIAFKFRRRKGYHKTIGHRQKETKLQITKIVV
ncbi:MAG: 50S ribosomal protein L21 [Candidatus Lindowbacteria bacterium]|nr:50S ribosomal protein L21 [Candidatus Lindowbacteria bacterium]